MAAKKKKDKSTRDLKASLAALRAKAREVEKEAEKISKKLK